MKTITTGRLLALVEVIVPFAAVALLVWYMVMTCMPTTSPDCILAVLGGTVKGLVFVGIMLTAGGLLALTFTGLDRLLGIRPPVSADSRSKRPR